jgi:hypothetical protein
MTESNTILSYHFGIDSCVSVYSKPHQKIYHVSFSKVFNRKHLDFNGFIVHDRPRAEKMLEYVIQLIKEKLNIDTIDVVLHSDSSPIFDNFNSSHIVLSDYDMQVWYSYIFSNFDKTTIINLDPLSDTEHFLKYEIDNSKLLSKESIANKTAIAYSAFSLLSCILFDSNAKFHYIKSVKKAVRDFNQNKPLSSVLISSNSYIIDSIDRTINLSNLEKPSQEFIDFFSKIFSEITESESSTCYDRCRFYKHAIEYNNIFNEPYEDRKRFAESLVWVAQNQLEKNILSFLSDYNDNMIIAGEFSTCQKLNEKIDNVNLFVTSNPGSHEYTIGSILHVIDNKHLTIEHYSV